MKKQKKEKVSFSLGGLVLDHYYNTLDQLDQVDTLLPASPKEVAMALPREQIGDWMFMYEAHVHIYNSKNDVNYLCYYSGIFALGGDTEKEFTKHHWMIDSDCTDHLTPFKDDFAHLGTSVCSAPVTNGQ